MYCSFYRTPITSPNMSYDIIIRRLLSLAEFLRNSTHLYCSGLGVRFQFVPPLKFAVAYSHLCTVQSRSSWNSSPSNREPQCSASTGLLQTCCWGQWSATVPSNIHFSMSAQCPALHIHISSRWWLLIGRMVPFLHSNIWHSLPVDIRFFGMGSIFAVDSSMFFSTAPIPVSCIYCAQFPPRIWTLEAIPVSLGWRPPTGNLLSETTSSSSLSSSPRALSTSTP